MSKFVQSNLVSMGLAIFSMLFGAGNLMYPLLVGMNAGDKNIYGIMGFMITAVCLPIIGFVAMLLFNGDYNAFFNRLGRPLGFVMISVCMLVIGPLIAIPRITTLSHIMVAPFMPFSILSEINPISSFIFSLLFLGSTFLLTYKESNIVNILGSVISPLLLTSLAIIVFKGLMAADTALVNNASAADVFKTNLMLGYETLDLLGALFFSSIVISLLRGKDNKENNVQYSSQELVMIGLKSGLIGILLLAGVYAGMSLLGVYHGHGFEGVNAGELFREISFRVLGSQGAAVIATAVVMACLSTSIALSAVVAEYVRTEIFSGKIGYAAALLITLLACIPMSTAGLSLVLKYTAGVLTFVGYPVLITLTFANILYKLYGFKSVKIPVFITFVLAVAKYNNFI
jgi:LIVCS family branched-chain amino acid:cation transporter